MFQLEIPECTRGFWTTTRSLKHLLCLKFFQTPTLTAPHPVSTLKDQSCLLQYYYYIEVLLPHLEEHPNYARRNAVVSLMQQVLNKCIINVTDNDYVFQRM
jgi:hypothetical protein